MGARPKQQKKPARRKPPAKPRTRTRSSKPVAGRPRKQAARSARKPAAPAPRDGAPKHVAALRALARRARVGAEPLVRTYILALARGKRGVIRAGGSPIGVTEHTRPKYGEQLMQHLVTLDLDAMPELRQDRGLASARAVALFISDAMDNCAFDPGTKETAVVVLGREDVARGEWSGPAVADPAGSALAAWPLDVPARVFTFDRYAEGLDEDEPIALLHDELLSACRAGGPSLQWSGDDPDDGWLFQFNEDLMEINLGDAGTMWAFRERAYSGGH